MAEYRQLNRSFWIDGNVKELTDKQKLFLIYAITGIESCISNETGIYELSRASFQNYLGWNLDEVDEIIEFFNKKRPNFLEYNHEHHIIYVKNFLKHNSGYKKDLSGIVEDFNKSGHKVPEFWADFGQRYRKKLNKTFEKLPEEEQKFLLNLFELKDKKPTNDIGNCHIEKMAAQNCLQSY